MSVVEHDTSAETEAGFQFWRPSRPLSVLLDAVLGVAAYLASYWLRFHQGEQLATFLAVAWSTAPLVVGGQLVMLAVAQAYARKPRASWLFRVQRAPCWGRSRQACSSG